jgi:malate/lactate dehydrogenase
VLGSAGVEKVLEVDLSDAELNALQSSAASVHEGQSEVAQMLSLA